MEIFDIKKELEGYDPEEIDRIKLLLQRINDTIEGGLRSANFKEYRNTYVINAQDSLDATYPMYVHFNIISEMVKIVSIKLSFWFLNFRSYSKAGASAGTPSGGGSTTPSGGGSTTPSGGGATSGSGGGQTSSYKTTPSGGGSTTGYKGTPSGGGHTSGAGGSTTRTSSSESGSSVPVITSLNTKWVTGVGDQGTYGLLLSSYSSSYAPQRIHTHTVTIPNHYHSVYNHTHPSHTHSTPSHTHPSHAHTVANHTHSTPSHTHSTPNHTHSTPDHTHPNHTHTAVYGIFEEETSPTIVPSISRDNGLTYSLPIGSYTKDHENLDITRFIDKAGGKMIKFTSTTRARLSVQIEIKLDIKAR